MTKVAAGSLLRTVFSRADAGAFRAAVKRRLNLQLPPVAQWEASAEMAAITREKDSAFYYATSHGFPSGYIEFVKGIAHPVNRGSVIGRTLIEGKPVQISDVLSDPEYAYREFQKIGGFRTMLGVPLLREGTPIGVLLLARPNVQPFTQKQIGLVETFADQAVIAIENVR
ncbi:MAG: GAF domain-containing protein, partial [Pseudolabrys sp.]